MLKTIWEILIHTPWWVYLILAYVLNVGIRASKTRVVALKKLFIVPAIFLFMSIHTLVTSIKIDIFTVTIWSLAILLGTGLGWWQIARYQLQVDKKHGLIRLPGTWSTLLIIAIIFITKYYFGYQQAVNPDFANQASLIYSLLAVSGICTGLFIGRLICYLYRMETNPQTDLATVLNKN